MRARSFFPRYAYRTLLILIEERFVIVSRFCDSRTQGTLEMGAPGRFSAPRTIRRVTLRGWPTLHWISCACVPAHRQTAASWPACLACLLHRRGLRLPPSIYFLFLPAPLYFLARPSCLFLLLVVTCPRFVSLEIIMFAITFRQMESTVSTNFVATNGFWNASRFPFTYS